MRTSDAQGWARWANRFDGFWPVLTIENTVQIKSALSMSPTVEIRHSRWLEVAPVDVRYWPIRAARIRSNVQGCWILPADGADGDYWAGALDGGLDGQNVLA
ncbi:hypothetical protein E8E13_002876 [Curvularia kusanoi]|uniref:Uncharacterized protein n=1 Tax=Curvularia kusanoi TaxID=90978 RepID=A0A9P4T7G3_CURKU|nr:hypothetical protein E8E13_002876 [Curvularia kusanoi]